MLPHSGKNFIWIGRIHDHVTDPGGVVGIKNALPVCATVCRFEDAAFGVWGIRIADDACIDSLRMKRIDQDPMNVAGLFQSHTLPGASGIERAVYAFAEVEGVAGVTLACSHPDG